MIDFGESAVKIATAIVTTVITIFGAYLMGRKARPPAIDPFKYYPPPDLGALNKDFYRYFGSRLRRAKSEVYNFGSGFEAGEFDKEEGRRVVEDYFAATIRALQNGVKMTRIQNRNKVGAQWADMLKRLILEFPDQFSLYYLEVEDLNVLNFCVIDQDRGRSCVVEMMISSPFFKKCRP